jgi:antitoxin HigA-1
MATTKVSLAVHPGEHIADELDARDMTPAELARAMGVDPGRVSRLLHAQTSITADSAIRLAGVFGTSAEFWMRLQGDYDLAIAREARAAS